MVRIDFGLHYSKWFKNEEELFEEMADFIKEQYEDMEDEENLLSSDDMTTEEMFYELYWTIEKDGN